MRISIIGSGYVGLSGGVGLVSKGHDVTLVDIDEEKVEKINSGEPPIYEEGMEKMLNEALENNKLKATTDTEKAIKDTEVTFIAVGTPSDADGKIDLTAVKAASRDVGKSLKENDSYHVISVKSTVVPETVEDEIIPILEKYSNKKAGSDFSVCMTPEFLREGVALDDFLNPDRIVIGELDERSGNKLEEVYKDFDAPIVRTSIKAAEIIKYASNSLLATKITFANEIGNICKKLDVDVYDVMDAVGLDHRINRDFLNAGCGYGGSCFPKDVKALINKSKELGHEPELLKNVDGSNERQKTKIVELAEEKIGKLDGKHVGILGLSFKPGTDDIRESPAINVIQELLQKNCTVHAHDPKAMENMKELFPEVNYYEDPHDVLQNSEVCKILTDWDNYNNLNKNHLSHTKVFEGKRVLDEDVNREGLCW
ncbi:MAG: UDP-glucose/GDP-mannose dehydrogenase family protein [Candidatus Aenigmatarchaeota archaeon]